MNENTENKVRFVPAICSHCGGSLDVDPSQEAAVCPYCGTAFIVEKAINHYNMEHAEVNHVDHIEHVDNVTVDLKGSFDSVLGFASEQMKESRKMKAEMLNEQAARSLNRDKFMFKALFGMMEGTVRNDGCNDSNRCHRTPRRILIHSAARKKRKI